MAIKYDLHSHSTASDGTLSPALLVEQASTAGIDVLALTDHDTLNGIAEARRAASRLDIRLLAGVEISVTWKKATVHILGLGVEPDNADLKAGLDGLSGFREWRATEIARRLEKHDFSEPLAGAKKHCKGAILSRTHFAHYITDTGRARSIKEVFKKFLVPGKPGYVRGDWASLEDAVSWILAANGLAVIAHPARYRFTRTKLQQLILDFKRAGGVGLEVVSGSHSADESRHMAVVAREHELMASCGSDFHGPEKPWVQLGRLRPLPLNCHPVWEHASWDPAFQ